MDPTRLQTVILHQIRSSASGKATRDSSFTRQQFPIRLCYAMTVNKSQGQTLGRVGIILRTPIFSHGQLFVALSRVRSMGALMIVNQTNDDERKATNVVYQEVLDSPVSLLSEDAVSTLHVQTTTKHTITK